MIALIITIVVMLILVGVVVSTTINSNLFNKVKEAGGDWKEAEEKDSNISKVTIGGVEYNDINEYMLQTLCEHEYGEWTVVKAPTIYENGERYRTCTKCEIKQTETTSVEECEENAHTYGEWIIDTEATCVAKGSKHQTCSTCGKILTEEIAIDEDNHELDEDGKCTREGCDAQSYIGYYADIDKNGEVDGIIYADLAFNGEGEWGSNGYGTFSYSKKDIETLNDYYISQEEYQYKSFNKKPVIAPINKDNNEANDRFYVMALEDFTTEAHTGETDETKNYPAYTTYYFYKNATNKNNSLVTEVGFSSEECIGRKNTKAMMEIWGKNEEEGGYVGATQDNQDIWKHIGTEVANGWFIPSRAEWAAFGKFATDQGVTPDTKDDDGNYIAGNYYRNYGLSDYNWSSSQYNTAGHSWGTYFRHGLIGTHSISISVRLSTTF